MVCNVCNIRVDYKENQTTPPAPSAPVVPDFYLELQQLKQTVKTLVTKVSGFDEILAENASLKRTVAAMKEEMKKMRTSHLPQPQYKTTTNAPAVQSTNQSPIANRSWANIASARSSRPISSERKRSTAARAFQTIEGPQGYEFVYIQRHRRMDRSDIRRRLRHIGLDTSRIMDITFPSRNALGLLIHIQYKTEMCALLNESKITPLTAFDPLDPKHIADPKHDTLSANDRAILASQLHRERLTRGLKFMRPHVAPAVAKAYAAIGWIDESDIPARSIQHREHPAAAFQNYGSESDRDEEMSQGTDDNDL
jgi:hypothetical protein